ncbi:peroxisomal carnitine O-octanoyltransferase-like [Liolophura sinensis]|uniref:peroxisomal carnitine O-octanoyltransferase-like n=1 Tax=Liolophura sinensis TaxID=3198878 RepID=UPI003159461F
MDGMDPDFLYTSEEEKTFQYQDSLPSLPLPSLDQTLRKYLDSVRPHVTDEEYRQTEFVVQQFGSGVGRDLHAKLAEKAKCERNWLEKWWDQMAYLDFRYPCAPLVNFSGPGPEMLHYWPAKEGSQCERAGLLMYYAMKYWEHLRKERLRVDKARDGRVFCMNQYQRPFSTCKIPGIKRDQLKFYFQTESQGDSPTHLVVLCRGQIFSFELVDNSGEILTAPEIQRQFERIKKKCEASPPGPGVGALTGDMRTTWAKMRNHLIALHPDNWRLLETIQKAVMVIVLEDVSPKDETEISQHGMAGDSTNRWFDKATSVVVFNNGLLASNCDHAPFEAMVMISNTFYVDLCVKYYKGKWHGSTTLRSLPDPDELVFVIDDVITDAISKAKLLNRSFADNLEVFNSTFTDFGKSLLKSVKVHPDTCVQMALQLAYYRMYKKPAPTYETGTTRKFWHGRTETVRACTPETLRWTQSMADNSSWQTRLYLFNQAVDKHNRLMAEAQENNGCDRHLLGLYAMSQEEGIPLPALYTDPSYNKSGGGGNFTLSTSFVGYTTVHGGVAPMCENGYGTFYRIQDDSITMLVTAWKTDDSTSAVKFTKAIHQSLRDIRELVEKHSHVTARL